MNLNFLVVLIISLLFVGCGATQEKINIDTPPKLQVPKKVIPVKKRKGALYSRQGSSLFADKKDLQIGDIIQIKISETVENESTIERKTSRSNNTDINGGVFTPPTSTSSIVKNTLSAVNKVTGIRLDGSSNNTFTGKAESDTDEEFTTTISAIIVQTFQNGNYFIKGDKELLINGQKQIMKISGIIRPYDITPDNSINSSQIANLKILYNKAGEEMESIQKPWGSKILESISPF